MSKNNVLTLFNGISGCHLALDRANIDYGTVYYAEIDKFANKVTEANYPEDVPLGDVTKWREWDLDWSSIGLVTAGFPCQAWSVAGKQLGDKDERGMLFWTTLDIISHVLKHNPKAKFLMENVKMKKDFEQYITHHTEQALGNVEKILINSALVSAQNRNRYYWTNFEVTQPDDKGILLRDILEYPMDDKYKLSDEAIARFKPCQKTNSGQIGTTAHEGKIGQRDRVYDANGKMVTLTATIYKQPPQYAVTGAAIRGRYNEDGTVSQRLELDGTEKTNTLTTVQKDNVVVYNTANNKRIKGITEDERGFRPHKGDKAKSGISECGRILKESADKTDTVLSAHAPKLKIGENNGILYRKLTPVECERLQTVPDNFTASISNSQRYKALGNGWTIDVIAHILECSGLPKKVG